MRTIWKYRIEIGVVTDLEIHGRPLDFQGPQVLHTAFVADSLDPIPLPQLMVWALVDTTQPESMLTFHSCATGRALDQVDLAAHRHVGTAVEAATGEVWHVFVAGEA